MRLFLTAAVLAASLVAPAPAEIRPDQVTFRELYKELVETNTTLSAGSCTLAAERMAARLKAAGYKEGDIRLSTGATDGRFLNAAGIPTYGVPGRFSDPDGNGVHGLNERKSVEGLYEERDYLFELIQAYANSK